MAALQRTTCSDFPEVVRNAAFTLLEITLAVAILGLLFTAVIVSFRSSWNADQTKRGARQVELAWNRARSYAWRDGREWTVTWEDKSTELRAMPSEVFTAAAAAAESPDPEGAAPASAASSSLQFSTQLDEELSLMAESEDPGANVVQFLPNGRVRHASVLVVGPGGDAWRIRTSWSGSTVTEFAGYVKE